MLDIYKDFPLLVNQKQINPQFCYFDNAATTHISQYALDAMNQFYSTSYAPIARSIYPLAEHATERYEDARTQIAQQLGVHHDEIIFTSGATAGINAIAFGWALYFLQRGDEILLTSLEHHATLLPWQQVAQRTGAILRFIPVSPAGTLIYDHLATLITHRTKIIAVTHCSNALGTYVDLSRIIAMGRSVGAYIFVDAAQSIPHNSLIIPTTNPDFLVFSGHKMGGPTGIGVMYLARPMQKKINPWAWGGGMVTNVTLHNADITTPPARYEAGTPPVVQAIGLAAAFTYLNILETAYVKNHATALCTQFIDGVAPFSQIRIVSPVEEIKKQGHIVSFVVDGMHAHDVAAYLGMHGICVRAGTHCAQPLATTLDYLATVRVSFYVYNTPAEVDYLVTVLKRLLKHGVDSLF